MTCTQMVACSEPTPIYTYSQTGFTCSDVCSGVLIGNKCYPAGTGNLPVDRCIGSFYYDYESCEELANNMISTAISTGNFQTSEWNRVINDATTSDLGTAFVNHIQYQRSYDIVMDEIIQQDFNFQSNLRFVLGKFAVNGSFLGFKDVTVDLTQCHERNDIALLWQNFGTNFYSDCFFNLPVLSDSEPSLFYNLYLQDVNDNLLDIPILIRNIGNNNMPDSGSYQLFKRFFMHTVLNNERILTAFNSSFLIQVDVANARRIHFPLLTLQYVLPSVTAPDYSDISFDQAIFPIYDFHFSVIYIRDLSSFWRQVIIVLIVFLVLALLVWIIRSVIYAKHHKDDGTTIAFFFSLLCGSFGTALTFITFIVTFFMIFIFFKWQRQGFFCLPPENEFWYISVIVWVAFVLMLISSIIRIFLQTRANIFVIDWETPHTKHVKVSAWRRLMVANELNRILKMRSYSIPLSLVFLLFLLEGFDLTLLAAPIPRTELIDVGKTYKVLHFGFTSFVWILLMLAEYGLNLLVWKFIGNPYLNFIDLCATSNCSVLIMNTRSQGYYIHGRSVHDHTDVDMEKLNDNMVQESNGNVGLRGLQASSDKQVFHVYLEDDFSYSLNETYSGILRSFTRKALVKAKAQNIKSRLEVELMAAFDTLNRYLRKFFDGNDDHPYSIQNSTFIENFLGTGPLVGDTSILTIQGDFSYRESLLIGIEWTLNVMYLLLFAGVEMETKSPSIAAFVVFIFDQLIMYFYSNKAKANLSRKAIIDKRYIVS